MISQTKSESSADRKDGEVSAVFPLNSSLLTENLQVATRKQGK